MKGFSVEINRNTLSSPKNRLILCIFAFVLAVIFLNGNQTEKSFKREDMTHMTAVFKDCRFSGSQDHSNINSNNIYLLFEDGERLNIHSNCATDELTQRLFDLDAGTNVEMLVDEASRNITELIVDGETWLPFDTVQRTMNRVDIILDWAACALFIVGAVLALSVIPFKHTLFRKEEK